VPVKKTLFIILIIPLSGYLLFLSRAVISPFVLAFFLAYAINPLVEWLQKKGARREYAIFTVYFVLVLAMAVMLGIILPRLVEDMTQVLDRLPQIYQELETWGDRFNQFYWKLPINLKPIVAKVIERMEIRSI
jgi:predicted PurR-regulated permease PerM